MEGKRQGGHLDLSRFIIGVWVQVLEFMVDLNPDS